MTEHSKFYKFYGMFNDIIDDSSGNLETWRLCSISYLSIAIWSEGQLEDHIAIKEKW